MAGWALAKRSCLLPLIVFRGLVQVAVGHRVRRRVPAMGGQFKPVLSSRFQYLTRPVPSQTTIFIRPARFARKTSATPFIGSWPSVSFVAGVMRMNAPRSWRRFSPSATQSAGKMSG